MKPDKELLKEAGFKIKDVYQKRNQIHVKVEEPRENLKTRVFHFGSDLAEDKKYVKDGEIVEEPKWKIKLRNILKDELEEEVSTQNFDKHKDEEIDL